MSLEAIQRLVLYWLLDDDRAVDSMNLASLMAPWDGDAFDIRLDAAVLRMPKPRESEVLDALKSLIREGYAEALVATDGGSRPEPITDLASLELVPDATFLPLTAKGYKEAHRVAVLMNGEAGQRARAGVWRRCLEEESGYLTFHPIAPKWVPPDVGQVPDVVVNAAGSYMQLDYSSMEESFSGRRLLIEETTKRFQMEWPYPEHVNWDHRISGVEIRASERHITAAWPIILLSWEREGVMYRLVELWKAKQGDPIQVDDPKRRECLAVARSMIDQLVQST